MKITLDDLMRSRQPFRTEQLLTILQKHGFSYRNSNSNCSHIVYRHREFSDIGNVLVKNSTDLRYPHMVGRDCARTLSRKAELAAPPIADQAIPHDYPVTKNGNPSDPVAKNCAVEFSEAAAAKPEHVERHNARIAWVEATKKLAAKGYDGTLNTELKTVRIKHAVHQLEAVIDCADIDGGLANDTIERLLTQAEDVDNCIGLTFGLLQETKLGSFSATARSGELHILYKLPGLDAQTMKVPCFSNGRVASRDFLAVCDWYACQSRMVFTNSGIMQSVGIVQSRSSPQESAYESFFDPAKRLPLAMPPALAAHRRGAFQADSAEENLIDPAFRQNFDQVMLDAETFNHRLSKILTSLLADVASYRDKMSDLHHRMHYAGFTFDQDPFRIGDVKAIKIQHPSLGTTCCRMRCCAVGGMPFAMPSIQDFEKLENMLKQATVQMRPAHLSAPRMSAPF